MNTERFHQNQIEDGSNLILRNQLQRPSSLNRQVKLNAGDHQELYTRNNVSITSSMNEPEPDPQLTNTFNQTSSSDDSFGNESGLSVPNET